MWDTAAKIYSFLKKCILIYKSGITGIYPCIIGFSRSMFLHGIVYFIELSEHCHGSP